MHLLPVRDLDLDPRSRSSWTSSAARTRRDSAKALWIIFVILTPYLGVFDLPDREPRRDGRARTSSRCKQQQAATDDLHPVCRRAALRREIEKAEGPARLRRDHAGRVRRDQAEGARRLVARRCPEGAPLGRSSRLGARSLGRCPTSPLAQPARRGRSVQHKILRIAAWIVGTLIVLGRLSSPGSTSSAGSEELWDTLTEISIGYIILGCFFQGLQTVLTALGWYGILRYAYPGGVTYMPVLARVRDRRRAQQLPAREHGHVRDARSCTSRSCRARRSRACSPGYVVQKIFYVIIGTLIYIYLFMRQSPARSTSSSATSGTRSRTTPCSSSGSSAGAIFLIAILLRIFWALGQEDVGEGEAGRGDPRRPRRVREARRCCRRWAATRRRSMVIIVFLAAYGIPVTFGSVMSVLGSNQLANILSFTPGGDRREPGVQLVRARQLHGRRRPRPRTRLGQQLITTAFNVGFAIVLICVVFGWQRRLEARQGLVRRRQGQEGRDER